jgi:hypothetical protein
LPNARILLALERHYAVHIPDCSTGSFSRFVETLQFLASASVPNILKVGNVLLLFERSRLRALPACLVAIVVFNNAQIKDHLFEIAPSVGNGAACGVGPSHYSAAFGSLPISRHLQRVALRVGA